MAADIEILPQPDGTFVASTLGITGKATGTPEEAQKSVIEAVNEKAAALRAEADALEAEIKDPTSYLWERRKV